MEDKKMYTVNEVAAILGKSIIAVRKIVARHNLGTKVGRDWILTEADLEKVRKHPGPGRPPQKAKP